MPQVPKVPGALFGVAEVGPLNMSDNEDEQGEEETMGDLLELYNICIYTYTHKHIYIYICMYMYIFLYIYIVFISVSWWDIWISHTLFI